MIRRIAFITLALITAATLWPAHASAQQLVPAGRREVTLSTAFVSGASNFNLNLSYALPNSPFDALFRFTSISSGGVSATGFLIGGRYHFGVENPLLNPYVLAGFSTASAAGLSTSALVFGVGASFNLTGPFTAYGNLVTNTGGGGLGYDFGIEYAVAEQFSLLLGLSGTNVSGVSSSGLYAGVGFRF